MIFYIYILMVFIFKPICKYIKTKNLFDFVVVCMGVQIFNWL